MPLPLPVPPPTPAQFTVGSWTYDAATTVANFTFSAGAFQGSRGENGAEGTYVENVLEELDAPAEWFFDETDQVCVVGEGCCAPVSP